MLNELTQVLVKVSFKVSFKMPIVEFIYDLGPTVSDTSVSMLSVTKSSSSECPVPVLLVPSGQIVRFERISIFPRFGIKQAVTGMGC